MDMMNDSRIDFAKARGGTPSAALMSDALNSLAADAKETLGAPTVERFCRRLRDGAEYLAADPMLAHPADLADAFHYLLTTIAVAIDHAVVGTDPVNPMFSPPMPTHRMDWGARNPDGVYRRAHIRDDLAYRVHGVLGTARYFTFDLVRADHQNDTAYLIGPDDLSPAADGSFEFFLGGPERPEKWFPLRPGIQAITTREFFDDWNAARRSVLRIDCLDPRPEAPIEHRAARVTAEFDIVGDWLFEGGVRYWLSGWHAPERTVHTSNAFDPGFFRSETKRPTYSRGCWQLAQDEALLIEFPDFEADYWGLQLASALVHTLDFANRLTTVNSAQAHRDDDGKYRLVLAHQDPGLYNWLDTTGLAHGELIMRFHNAVRPSPPGTRVIKSADIESQTTGQRRCSAVERREQVQHRRAGVANLLCD
jgi:hypothetical protein